jgi:photosystem II stability/assembly factor-like uncharacterized protein
MTHHRHLPVPVIAFACLVGGGAVLLASPQAEGPTPGADRLASFAARQQMEKTSILRNLEFRNIGPIQMNGRLVDVEFPDPRNPYTFLIAYASGGLWKTTNNGTTFEPLMDDQSSIIMGDVAVDPRNPNVYWVGTGEKNASRSTYSGTGVFRTADGGRTWTHMGLADTERISRIIVSPRDSNTVWVAAQGPLYTDSDARGVYMTTDGGKTWKKTLYVDGKTGASDLALHPRNPRILYAGMWQKDRKAWKNTPNGPESGVYRSEDGGQTWKKLAGGLPSGEGIGRIGLAVTPAAPDTLFVSVDNQTPKPDADQPKPSDSPLAPEKLRSMTEQQFLALRDQDIQAFLRRFNPADTVDKVKQLVRDGKLSVKDMLARLTESDAGLFDKEVIAAQLFRSNDRGATFTQTNTSYLDGVYSTFGYYFGDFAVSPRDANTIYLLGVPIIKSTDGGRTWASIGSRGVHSDHHALWIDPNFPDHIVNGNDGGLNISWDGGKTWIDVANIPVGQFYSLAVDMAEPYNVYGGLQDNGVWMGRSDRSWDNNEWRSIGGGDGMQVQVDSRTNRLYVRGSQYGSYRATDEATNTSWTVRPLGHVTEQMNRYNWQTPILFSPHTPEILYYGTQRLYRSFDQGHTFNAVSGDLTTNRQPNWSDTPYSTLVTISESPITFGLIYVGSDDGRVHVTRDGGGQWADISQGLAPDRYVSRVIASQHQDGVAYVTQTGYRDDDWKAYLFRTADYGKTWTSIKGNLPDEPVNVIREDPKHPEILYAGTDLGVFISLDTGRSWQTVGGNLPHVPVHDVLIHPRDNDLVVGTHGRSVFVMDVKPIQTLLDTEQQARVIDQPLHVFAVKDVQAPPFWTRESQVQRRNSFFQLPEQTAATFVYYAKAPGKATLTIKDADGNPLRVFEDEAEAGLNVIKWNGVLDTDLAKKAEAARAAKAPAPGDRPAAGAGGRGGRGGAGAGAQAGRPQTPFEDWMTWYVDPGAYTLEVTLSGDTKSTGFRVVRAAGGFGFFGDGEGS